MSLTSIGVQNITWDLDAILVVVGIYLLVYLIFTSIANSPFIIKVANLGAQGIKTLFRAIFVTIALIYFILMHIIMIVLFPCALYMIISNYVLAAPGIILLCLLFFSVYVFGFLFMSVWGPVIYIIYPMLNFMIPDFGLQWNVLDYNMLDFSIDFSSSPSLSLSNYPLELTASSLVPMQASNPNIPWHETGSMVQSLSTLNTIYDFYVSNGTNKDLSTFFSTHCEFLTHRDRFFNSSTPVPQNIFTKDFWANVPYLPDSYAGISGNKGKSGVYSFYIPELDKYYIGSAINLNMRLHTHYADVGNIERWHSPFYADVSKIGMENVKYTVLATVPNYYDLLTTNYSSVIQSERVQDRNVLYAACKFFTQFDSYCIEQAVQHHIRGDSSYHNTNVKFPQTWPPVHNTLSGASSRPIVVEFENGETINMSSIKQASRELGINSWNLSNVLNFNDQFKNCTLAPRAKFYELGVLPLETSPWPSMARGRRPDFPMINFDILSYDLIYVIDSDHNIYTSFNTVDSAREAAGLGTHSKAVRSNINTTFVTCPAWGNKNYLFAQNPYSIGVSVPMVSLDEDSHVERLHASVKDIVKDLKLEGVFNTVAFKTAIATGVTYTFKRSADVSERYTFMRYSKRYPISPLSKGTYVGIK